MKILCRMLFLSSLLFWAQLSYCSSLSAKLGPGTVGFGGSNPLTIPPNNPVDWELSYVTNNLWELNASVIPGYSFGKRVEFSNIYAAGGLGVLLSLDGLGGGVYTSVGFDSSINSRNLFGFVAEYKQSFGFSGYGRIMSYALRFGASVNF